MPLVRPFLLTGVQSGAIKGNNTQFTGGCNGQQNRVRPIRPLELLDCKPRCPIKRSRNRSVIKTACLQCPLQGADPFNRVVLRTNGLESDPNTLSYDLLAFDRAKRSRAGNLSVCIAHFGAFDFLDDDCLNDRWTDVIGITAPIVGSLNLPHINQHIRRLCHLHRDTCANHRETAGK